jgi:hypothetical protein
MPFEPLGQSNQLANAKSAGGPEPLSPTGQIIGWGIYGALVLIGFAFGIVTGYERPKTITVAKANTEADPAKPDTHKADPPKPTPKANPSPEPANPQPVNATPKDNPSTGPMPATPATPKADPKTPTPMPMTPATPKVDPKPPMPTTPATPKVDTTPKKEELKPVSFKADVLPILRTHCVNCHGAVGKPKGNVDLTTLAKIMKSGDKMVVPGNLKESDIYTSIVDREMPKDKPKPNDKEMLILKNWILTGAKE